MALTQVKAGQEETYETFLERVKPVWARHGMALMLRARTVSVMSARSEPVPMDVAVISYATRAGFNAYLADADYRAISHLRTEALAAFAVVEAQIIRTDAMHFLQQTPMALMRFVSEPARQETPALSLSVDLVAEVQGGMGQAWQGVEQIDFVPLSFDDNPMEGAVTDAVLTVAATLVR